jgi:hypothetical protein
MKNTMSIKTLKLSFMALALLLGSFVGNVSAQPEEGDQELQLSADFVGNHKFKSYATSVEASYGFFVTDELELGARLGYVGNFPRGASSAWAATVLPFIDYHFRGISEGDKILPYVGAFGGFYLNDRDEAYAVGPEAGVKFFVYDKTFINTQYRYEFFDSLNTRDAFHEFRVAIGFLF